MKIISLELNGYKRLALNAINTIKFTPSELVQLIIGTNGSGKSSLMQQLTPLPPDSNDFIKTGHKIIELMSGKDRYVLKSVFAPSTKHSFIKNDEELNPGGTVTVFKELVKQEFNLTPEIHDLLMGMELFHDMSPARRREWFTNLSDTSYDYALLVYGRLKERYRDVSGALKMAKKHLVAEGAKVISEAEETRLKQDIDVIHKELNFLMEQSAPVERSVSDLANEEQLKMEELSKLSTRLLRMRFVAPHGTHPYGVNPLAMPERDEWGEPLKRGFNSIAEIDGVINEINYSVAGKEALLNAAVTKHSALTESVEILTKAGEDGIRSLHVKLVALRTKRDVALQLRKLKIEGLDPVNAMGALDSIYEMLTAVAMAIPENSDKRFSQARMGELNGKLLEIKNNKLSMVSELTRAQARKIHLESHKANTGVECPKCRHKWIPGFSDAQLEQCLESIAKLEEDIDRLDKQVGEIEVELNAVQEYSEFYKDYVRCIKNWPVLQPFWDYLMDGNYIITSPRLIVPICDKFRKDLEHGLEAKAFEKEIAEVMALLESAQKIDNDNLAEQQEQLDNVTIEIETLTSEMNNLQASAASYQKYKKQLTEATELGERISALMADVSNVNEMMVEMLRRETISHCIKQLQSSLALKETAMQKIVLQKGIVADLNKQIDKLVVDEEAAKRLLHELSPTNGLIAEGLLGFIKNFVNQMNSMIRKIWSYPLQVQHCGVSNSELDYKFPLIVQTKSNTVSDVKFGSTAMREIIDLAFKIIAMRYLGISESPLYLDEFSASMDETHRKSAMEGIKLLMDTQHYTQLFMVSHYSNVYGVFMNAQTCVLCSANITVPSEYNKHVVMS